MPKKPNAVCSICGQPYYVCNACKSTKSLTPWRIVADTMDCYKVYTILRHYANGAVARKRRKNSWRPVLCPRRSSRISGQPSMKSCIRKLADALPQPSRDKSRIEME